jgi:uncharacterized membrane protein YgcG
MGPISVSNDGMIRTYDGKAKSTSDWNKVSDTGRTFAAESDDVGIKELPKGYFLNEDYSISEDKTAKFGQQYSYYVNNTKWTGGSNAGQESNRYASSSGGGGSTGGGGGGIGDPKDWTVV